MKTRNKVKYISLAIFAILTFVLSLTRIPFWDEARAFLVSQMSFGDIFQLTRIDGHPIFWYLLLKFSTPLKFYPYPFLILNWGLCLLALKILWDCAPFLTIHKIFITFSSIFYFYFAIVSRGYSLVLVFLFLICALYLKRFKKPYLFSFLIVMCANCELAGAIFCFWVGVVYLFELYKRNLKKLFYNVFFIFLSGALLFIVQMMGKIDYNLYNIYPKPIFKETLGYIFISGVRVLYVLTFVCFIVLFSCFFFKKNKKIALITLGSFLSYACIFAFVYIGSFWNYHFFYVYLILSCWLGCKLINKNKLLKILFFLILIYNLPINSTYKFNNLKMIYKPDSYKIAKIILDNPKYKNAKLYTLDFWSDVSPGADVYLAKNNVDLYYINGDLKNSLENFKNVYKFEKKKIDLKDVYSTFDPKKDNYLLTNRKEVLELIIPNQDYVLQLVDFSENAQLAIYTIFKK